MDGEGGVPLFSIATMKVSKGPIDDTFYVLRERTEWHSRTDTMSVDSVDDSSLPGSLSFSGDLYREGNREGTAVPYTMVIKEVKTNPFGKGRSVDFELFVEDGHGNRVFLTADSPADEKIYGHGVQYTSVNHKNKKIPVFISEQGIGRGLQPITGFLNTFAGGAGGNEFTSYGTKAQVRLSEERSNDRFVNSSKSNTFLLIAVRHRHGQGRNVVQHRGEHLGLGGQRR